jgi:hypothetical protein
MKKAVVVWCILVVLSIPVFWGCSGDKFVDVGSDQTPDFILTDLQGNDFQLSDHFGEVVLLDFFQPT